MVEEGFIKTVYIDGIKQEHVIAVECEVLAKEVTVVKISYVVDKFEVVKEKRGE